MFSFYQVNELFFFKSGLQPFRKYYVVESLIYRSLYFQFVCLSVRLFVVHNLNQIQFNLFRLIMFKLGVKVPWRASKLCMKFGVDRCTWRGWRGWEEFHAFYIKPKHFIAVSRRGSKVEHFLQTDWVYLVYKSSWREWRGSGGILYILNGN